MRIAVDGVRSAERDPRGGVLRQTAVVGEGSGDEQDIACRQFGRFRTEVGDAGPAVGPTEGDGAAGVPLGAVRLAGGPVRSRARSGSCRLSSIRDAVRAPCGIG